MSRKAEQGDRVRVHYTGKLDSGEVFDSSRQREPLEFQLGAGQVIGGFDRAVEGMEVGETREVRLDAKDAYGEPREELKLQVPRTELPEGVDPAVGDAMRLQDGSGQQHMARITEVRDTEVTLDLNHPLAGKALNFELELMDVE